MYIISDVLYIYAYIYTHICNILANSGVVYIHIHNNVYNIHADSGVMWTPYGDKHICMGDTPLT